MYDIYLNCQEKKRRRRRERVQNSHERNTHTHTHTLDKKIFCGCTRKKRIDSILWQKKRKEEREKKIRTSIYKVNTNENHCSSSN